MRSFTGRGIRMARSRHSSLSPPRTAIPRSTTNGDDDLVSRARSPQPGHDEIGVFKAELEDALASPGQLPGGELSDAAGDGDGSDEAFLRRLWHDLYPGEPIPGM